MHEKTTSVHSQFSTYSQVTMERDARSYSGGIICYFQFAITIVPYIYIWNAISEIMYYVYMATFSRYIHEEKKKKKKRRKRNIHIKYTGYKYCSLTKERL